MKKLWTFFIIMVVISTNLIGQVVEIGTGTSASYYYGPMYRSSAGSSFDYSRHSMLYTAADMASIPAGSLITQIAFYKNDAFATVGGAVFNIYMKNAAGTTSLTTGTTWGTANTGTTMVYSTASQAIAATTGWISFTLSTPFLYDGTGIQVLTDWNISAVSGSPTTGAFNWRYTPTTLNTVIGYANSAVLSNATSLTTSSYGGVNRPNIQITYTGAAPCAGEPMPGNTLASVASTCVGNTFSLSLQNSTSGTGVSFQWQSSLNNSTWTDIVGATYPSYSTTQTVNTWYRCNVTCSGVTGTSTPTQVTMNAPMSCYCPSIATIGGDEEIFSVTVNGATNAYNCTTVAPGPGSVLNRYSNFFPLGSLTTLSQGTTVNFTILEDECDGATYYSNGCAIWIDWNQNGSFADVGEQVYVEATTTVSPRTISGSFSVPLTALTGQTGMRIIVSEGSSGASLTPCMSYSYGETEDYIITVGAQPTCLPPANLTATNVTGFAAKLGWTEMGSSGSWELEYGPQGFTQGTGTIVSINTNNFYQLNGLTPSTNYAFYVRSNCDANGYSTWSGPKTFSTTVACPAPTALLAYNITTSGARVQYNSMGNLFKIEYGLFGFTQGTGTVITNVTDTAYNLTGLTHSSRYSYYVQQDCDVNGTSTWAGPYSFYTLCDVVSTFPFSETFVGAVLPPTICWNLYTDTLAVTCTPVAGGSWGIDDYLNVTTTTNKSAKMNIWSTNNTGWLVTPQFNLGTGSVNYTLDFDLGLTAYGSTAVPGLTGTDDKFAVVISTDGGLTWSSANTLRLWDNAGSPYIYNNISNTGEHISLSLAGYTGVVRIAFYGESLLSNADNDLFVDNVKILPPSTCPTPTTLGSTAVTAFQATAKWAGTTNANVQYGLQGFTLGSGTIVPVVADTFKVITGLNPSANYSFYVQKDCGGGDLSFWEGPVNFTTTSANVTTPSPANFATNIQINNDSLKWAAMPGVLGYRINVGTTSGGKDLVDSVLCTSNNYVHPTTWNFNQSVYWKVFTVYQSGLVEAASSGSSFSFTTTNGNVITPSPANFATGIQVNKDTLAWAPIVGATGYRINIGTTSGGKELLDSAYTATNFYKYLGGNFNFNQTIYWKVFTVLSNGGIETATTGSSFSFTTTNGKVTNPVPANNAAGIAKTATILNWDDVIGSLGYYILVGSTSGGRDVVDSVYCASSEFTAPADWNAGTVYFWRVYTEIPTGSVQGDVWKFTTQCDPYSVYPYVEDFTNWLTCWNLTGGTFNWTQAGTAPNNYAKANFWSQTSGNTDFMTSPVFNFSAMNQPALKFKWSHLYDASYPLDSLAINVSTDNGATWNNVWGKGAANLNSNDGAANTAPGTFVLDSADLASFAGSNAVIIRFQAHSGYGPDLFIDSVMVYDKVTTKSLNLTLFLEGLYNGTGMNEAYDDLGSHWGAGIADQITVELRNSTVPSIVEATYTGQNLSTTGLCTVTVPGGLADSYYVVIKHRNSVSTWSALPLSFSSSTISYDFTVASSDPLLINNAYGDNLIQVAPGVFAIYVGDVNQDGLVDGSDMSDTETENNNFTIGYVVTDVNGDGLVDGSDMSIVETANNNFVSEIQP